MAWKKKQGRKKHHDKTSGYYEQQRRRAQVADDRGDDTDLDTRLADGFDLMADEEKEKVYMEDDDIRGRRL